MNKEQVLVTHRNACRLKVKSHKSRTNVHPVVHILRTQSPYTLVKIKTKTDFEMQTLQINMEKKMV